MLIADQLRICNCQGKKRIVRMLGFVKNQVSKNQGIENLVVLDMGYTSDDVE